MGLISRQEAIEKLECFCMEKALEDQNHPSAEARTQMSSADLISRQDAIDAMDCCWDDQIYWDLVAALKAIPSAIIREEPDD